MLVDRDLWWRISNVLQLACSLTCGGADVPTASNVLAGEDKTKAAGGAYDKGSGGGGHLILRQVMVFCAQLRFTDVDGNRLTAFFTHTTGGQLADPQLRHRRRHRARCKNRIRNAKDIGLRNPA